MVTSSPTIAARGPREMESTVAAFWAGLSPGMVLSAKGLRTSAWFQRLEVSVQGQVRWARPGLLQDGLTLIREVIRASAEALLPNKVTATGAGRGRFELELDFWETHFSPQPCCHVASSDPGLSLSPSASLGSVSSSGPLGPGIQAQVSLAPGPASLGQVP